MSVLLRSRVVWANSLIPTAPAPLTRDVALKEILPPSKHLEPPNYLRTPLWKTVWEGQFNSGTFAFFGKSWITVAAVTAFLYWTRVFDPPPLERLDRYWLNSPKFRILSAFHNQGRRPGFAISMLTYEIRYFFRGIDHPFGMNEYKDLLFKLRENFIIESHPGVQYPYVFRQFNKVETPAKLSVNLYAPPQEQPHHH
eukprot:GHVN01087590.1.p1 GENE.GHVN01087590.1~~GHVN01087590.1.p1  ORF type:complete len:197 (+),score=19.17 GHVN01087590.1:59-649(+)